MICGEVGEDIGVSFDDPVAVGKSPFVGVERGVLVGAGVHVDVSIGAGEGGKI